MTDERDDDVKDGASDDDRPERPQIDPPDDDR